MIPFKKHRAKPITYFQEENGKNIRRKPDVYIKGWAHIESQAKYFRNGVKK